MWFGRSSVLLFSFSRNCGSVRLTLAARNYSETPTSSTKPAEEAEQHSDEPPQDREGWLSRLLKTQHIQPMKGSHSSLLADKEIVYQLMTHNVEPGGMQRYVDHFTTYSSLLCQAVPEASVVGSWKVIIGNQDQAVHLWRHSEGFSGVDKIMNILQTDPELAEMAELQSKMCKKRKDILMLPFSFWGEPKARSPKHIYELRSYILKPGTMIEWGNNWARGINLRRDYNQAVGGFFSQVGRLYMVFHLWAYESLSARKRIREETWRKPGWETNVAYTVPLISKMEAKIMVPNPCSTLQ